MAKNRCRRIFSDNVPGMYGHSATLVGELIFIFGGVVNVSLSRDIYILNTRTLHFFKLEQYNREIVVEARKFHSAVRSGRFVLVVGGTSGGGGNERTTMIIEITVFYVCFIRVREDDRCIRFERLPLGLLSSDRSGVLYLCVSFRLQIANQSSSGRDIRCEMSSVVVRFVISNEDCDIFFK